MVLLVNPVAHFDLDSFNPVSILLVIFRDAPFNRLEFEVLILHIEPMRQALPV
jgi:hypothetical protein